MTLLAELQRRKVFKVGAAYLVVAWLIVQAASIGFPAFDAPPWALRIFILIALLGFPAAVVMAWVFDVTGEGVKFDARATGTRRLLAAAAVMMMLALAWYFVGQPSVRRDDAVTAASEGKTPAKPEIIAAAVPGKSIAVLPFTDLSPGKDHEYFSDGMAEEILNALAHVEDLKVAGRTSSFSFRGKDQDLRAIGKALGVATILEGSVRKQGDKVRITAQLIQADDGFELWSETYDGELKDVFALQENIAQAITGNLQVILQGDQKSGLVRAGTTNAQAYTRYLQAASIFNRRDGEHYPMAIAALDQAVRIDPEFARAHARLAVIHILMGSFQEANYDESLATSEREARRALALDPGLAEAHAALALKYFYQRKPLQALATMDKAVALDPQDPTANFWRGLMLLCDGYVTQGLASLDRTLAIDPLMPNALNWRARWYLYRGDQATARRMLEQAAAAGLVYAETGLAQLAHDEGRDQEAIARFTQGMQSVQAGFPDDTVQLIAVAVFGGDGAARSKAIAAVEAYLATRPEAMNANAPWALMMLGEPARALSVMQSAPTINEPVFFGDLFSPAGKDARRLPQFAEFARVTGRAALWDHYGPPDKCRKNDKGDYVCD